MNCDIYNTETGKVFVNFELIYTPASHIWTHTIYKNQSAGNKLTGKVRHDIENNNSKSSLNLLKDHATRIKIQEEAVARINGAIELANQTVTGQTFPYEAYVGMDQQHCIKIHRAFTNAITSRTGWFHEGTREQKIEFKKNHAFGPYKREKIRSATPKKFTLPDSPDCIQSWEDNLEEINQAIHKYEITLQDIKKIDSEYFTYSYSKNFSAYMNAEDYNESIKPKYKKNNPEIFLFGCIHGRDYIETYIKDDDPTEFDVVNIENISSDFRIILNPENLYNMNSSTATDFQKWVQSYNIDINYALPIPLGKLTRPVDFPRLYDMTELARSNPGIIDIRFNL